jgi:hypothetical protein
MPSIRHLTNGLEYALYRTNGFMYNSSGRVDRLGAHDESNKDKKQ